MSPNAFRSAFHPQQGKTAANESGDGLRLLLPATNSKSWLAQKFVIVHPHDKAGAAGAALFQVKEEWPVEDIG